MRIWLLSGLLMFSGCDGEQSTTSPSNGSNTDETLASTDCGAWVPSGDPASPGGARWTYESTDAGIRFRLTGTLFTPVGTGPFPAVIVSHGYGGNAAGYSSQVARTMRDWGLVVIATNYTHAPGEIDADLLPQGADGASAANVERAHKALELLSCLGTVDPQRVAAHGHSMGAFVTGQLLGSYPEKFAAASHTAGGIGPEESHATSAAVAASIITPYQLHHGDADVVVPLEFAQGLAGALDEAGVPHELHVYGAYTHSQIALDALALERIRAWYQAHGVL